MGKYKKYFCMEIPTTLIMLGTIMGIFSLSLFIGDFVMSIILMTTLNELNGYFFAFVMCSMFSFCLAGILQSILCCRRDYSRNINKTFSGVIITSIIAVIFAITDGIWKLLLGSKINSIILFVYAFITIFVILIAYIAKRELFEDRLDELQKFNNFQGPSFATNGLDGIPKYPMTLHVEKLIDEDQQNLDCENYGNDERAAIV